MTRRTLLTASLGLAATATGCLTVPKPERRGFFNDRGLPIGLQLYTLGDSVKDDLEGTLKKVAAIGYRTLELAGISVSDAQGVRAAADRAGLEITSLHVGVNPAFSAGSLTLQDELAQLVSAARTLGCKDLLVPFPLLPDIKVAAGEDMRAAFRRALTASADPWKLTAELLNRRGRALRQEGLQLGYHNHSVEFLPLAATSGWDILMDQTDPEIVSFELDIGWVVAGGMDAAQLLKQLAGRVRQLHVKDLSAPGKSAPTRPAQFTEVGNGVVDWPSLLPLAHRCGVRQFYVEQEAPFLMDRFEAVSKSYQYLSQL